MSNAQSRNCRENRDALKREQQGDDASPGSCTKCTDHLKEAQDAEYDDQDHDDDHARKLTMLIPHDPQQTQTPNHTAP